ncbi:AraC family ligand binding domain-containing protein [Nocardiopsis valliformis]|uniref:AraC family ligand binding domain-containing protein n=1 Tax=Nocardiopsis valliformis TaxID=239974 RepID=UPI000476268E|nr:AraC family ligand binding domain-containing protein [Nocardiopsis valliformis]
MSHHEGTAQGTVRCFSPSRVGHWQGMDGHAIQIGPLIEKAEDGPLSAYYARFGRGETAALPAGYAEVWVVITGALTLRTGGRTLTAGPGDLLHVPEDSPGELTADEETELACVSVPAH